MREYWANVYPHVDAHEKIGGKFQNRSECDLFRGDHAKFRVHVRLKPEGAPKRYASEANRRAWELMPGRARQGAELGFVVCYSGPAEDADFWARNS